MLTQELHLPDHVKQLGRDETFCFACHPGVACFTECCRELELALTPYDALRLTRELGLTNSEFLDRYVVIEQEEGETFPRFYLGMVDDGRASCPFVSSAGCAVYNGRPGACRAYPVGRAAMLGRGARQEEFHVLVKEPHCRGFNQSQARTVDQWIADQGLLEYNEINDELLFLFQHPRVRRGLTLSQEQRRRFILALYRLDEFRTLVAGPGLGNDFSSLEPETRQAALDSDIELLRLGIRWLQTLLFRG